MVDEVHIGGGFWQSFSKVYKYLPILIGVFSAIRVIDYGLDYSISEALVELLASYDKWTVFFLGWLGTPITFLLGIIQGAFNVELSLGDHWRHIFIIVNFYYLRDVVNFANDQNLKAVAFSAVSGLICALATAACVGAIPDVGVRNWLRIVDLYESTTATFLVCTIFIAYGLLRSAMVASFSRYRATHLGGVDGFWNSFRIRGLGYVKDGGMGILIGFFLSVIFTYMDIGSPAILTTCSLTFLLSIFHVTKGWSRSKDMVSEASFPNPTPTRLRKFWIHGNTQLGMGIFGIFLAAFLIILIDAGGSLIM